MTSNPAGNIPFSWENKPGVRKDYRHETLAEDWWRVADHDHDNSSVKEQRRLAVHDSSPTKEGRGRLPPPPCENLNKTTCHDLDIPLPPCVFQPRLKSSSRRSKDDDPFLIAYKECTKSNKKGTLMRRNSILGSCKHSCSVRNDSIVRVAHIPSSNSDGKKFQMFNHQG